MGLETAPAPPPQHLLGMTYALATALTWAFALILFKLSGERVRPLTLNLFKNAVGLACVLVTLAVGLLLGWESADELTRRGHAAWEVGVLLVSGCLGIAIADTLFFRALNLIGVGLIAVVDCAYTPLVMLFSAALLGERLTPAQYGGVGFIIAGLFIASGHQPPVGRTRGQILGGMALALLAIALMAFGIVFAKPVLEHVSVVWSTAIRLGAGFGLLALFTLVHNERAAYWSVFRPAASWRVALPASFLGTYICLLWWIGGFKYTDASIAAALNQTSVFFATLFAALILKEKFGPRQFAALLLGAAGVAVVIFSKA